ncbi:MAG: phosphatase PAP2 family protein [Candidatus Iainarchaeum archaeon]|uniref:Phosphatase PAP2 family protein n=1 Tax=Candidatus Iainarchaeum sp. TaxID=3101447 RepID=A0A7T9DKK9_9ARCH|nr:MAG: phosphatase PAP2 family protein [Candidatus Diapherotrites archaeon]
MLPPFPFEIAFSHMLQSLVEPFTTTVMIAFTWLGSPTIWIGLGLGLHWLHHKKLAVRILMISIITAFVVEGVKTFFARPRPGTEFLRLYTDGITEKSFPSGHATLVSAQTMHLLRYEHAPAYLAVLAAVLVLGVAISRVYLGLHYLGDVIAGIAIGSLLGWAFWKLHQLPRIQEWKAELRPYKYELLIAIVAIISLALMLLQKEIGSIAATLGFLVGFYLFDEEDPRQQPLAFEGLAMVKVVLGFFSTSLFVLLNWQLVGSIQGFGILSFVVYFFAGIYAAVIFPGLWARWIHSIQKKPRRKKR